MQFPLFGVCVQAWTVICEFGHFDCFFGNEVKHDFCWSMGGSTNNPMAIRLGQ